MVQVKCILLPLILVISSYTIGMDTYRSSDDILVLNIDMAYEILANISNSSSSSSNESNKDEVTFDIYSEMKLRLMIRCVYIAICSVVDTC